MVGLLLAGVTPVSGQDTTLDPADELAAAFLADRSVAAEVLPRLADALAQGDPLPEQTAGEIASLGRALSRRIAAQGPPWGEASIDLLLTTLLVHPLRFVEEPDFRERVTRGVLPTALDPAIPVALRDQLLAELNRVRGVDFEISGRVELAWGAARRSTAERRVPASAVDEAVVAEDGRIEATLLSLPSSTVATEEAKALVAALEILDPGRSLLVLTDGVVLDALEGRSRGANSHLLDSHGRAYTPWPRDPLLIAHRRGTTTSEGVLLIARPNRQPGRETDGDLARELVQQLPDALDRAWGGVRWTMAEVPFHNGQILLADGVAWVSLHGLEQPILERLGLDGVPVASFETHEGVRRYLDAARHEAERLARLFDRPVHFVHALPGSDDPSPGRTMAKLGGGAGFDLDSLLTFVRGPGDGPATALVADLDLGLALFEHDTETSEGLEELRQTYGLDAPVEVVRSAIVEQMIGPRGRRLDAFLEAVAEHLATVDEGAPRRIERLPLLLVPTTLLPGESLDHGDFLLGWNNGVASPGASGPRVEVFSSGFPAGDRLARQIYGDAGVELVLLPPLTASIVRNGGYRCASNHLRRAADGVAALGHPAVRTAARTRARPL